MMKKSISIIAALLLCSVFSLSSCRKNGDSKTVTVKYEILVNGDEDYAAGADDGGIALLHKYAVAEMKIISDKYDKSWQITETAETEAAAILACNKKAIAEFNKNIAAINGDAVAMKDKFNAKKAELLPQITSDKVNAKVIYVDYGGALSIVYDSPSSIKNVELERGTSVSFQAIGGEK